MRTGKKTPLEANSSKPQLFVVKRGTTGRKIVFDVGPFKDAFNEIASDKEYDVLVQKIIRNLLDFDTLVEPANDDELRIQIKAGLIVKKLFFAFFNNVTFQEKGKGKAA